MYKKKKLLVFHPTMTPYRSDLFNSLNEAFDMKVYLTWIEEDTFDYSAIYAQLKFKPDSTSGECWSLLDSFMPDIVIVTEYGPFALKVLLHRALKRRKYKVVAICDDSYNMLSEKNEFSRRHRWARRFVVPFMDELILVEKKSEQWYQHNYGKGFWFPIIRNEDRQRSIYQRTLSHSQLLMAQHNLENKNVFLFVGRFVALKNINRIIQAFSVLNKSDNALVLVGSGEEEDNIRKVIKSHGCTNVILTGRLEGDELYAWYNVADYFILASWQEAFGAVTTEALLAGCYSLVSKRAGSNCLIEEGVNGYTFDPMNTDEILKKMEEVVSSFPKVRPLNNVKKNLISVRYDEFINRLILRLNTL